MNDQSPENKDDPADDLPVQGGDTSDSFGGTWAKMWEQSDKPLGGETYDSAKRIMSHALERTPEPLRSIILYNIKHNAVYQQMMRSDQMADLFEMIGQYVELSKAGMRMWGMPAKASELCEPEYNHQFLVEDVRGKIVAVTEQQLLGLFPPPDPVTGKQHDFPHVVFTSSHARGETLKDVTGIAHGVESQLRQATQGRCKFAKVDTSRQDLGVKPDETLIIFRCDVRENPWLNGASFLKRLNEIERHERDGTPDKFKHASPGSWAINHMILAWMAENPETVLQAGDGPLAKNLGNGDARIELRRDDGRIVQSIWAEGYSKGGEVITTAIARMMPSEMTAKDKHGHDVIRCMQDGEMRGITQDGIHEVYKRLRQIPVWADAVPERKLSKAQIAAGARRDAFNNAHDLISSHENYEGSRYDQRWVIEGDKTDHGHKPEDALGTRDSDGYAMKDPRVRRRKIELAAPMIGKATLEGLRFDTSSTHRLILDAGAGTPDDLVLKHAPTMIAALAACGLHAELENSFPDSGEYRLVFKEAVRDDLPAMECIQRAFQSLRDDAPGLLISEGLLERDIAGQLEKLQPKSFAATAPRGRAQPVPACERTAQHEVLAAR